MLRNVYVLVQRAGEDYSRIPECAKVEFLCQESEVRFPNYTFLWARLRSRVKDFSPDDRMVINGPNWACAIAGYYWFGMFAGIDVRHATRTLIFDAKRGCYQQHDYDVNEVFHV